MTGCTYKCFTDTVHDTTKLHDFFFAEALDKLKDGGIMAFVTSAGTLDKRDESTRQMLADKADFIGAIRLPGGKNGAFKENAGTEVTTDIIFLQKREGKSVSEMSDIPDWVHIGETADGLPINKYFEQHPDMVLGTVVEGNKLYGSGTMVVAEDGFDLKTALHEAVGKLSAEISHERGRDVYSKTADGVQVQIPSKLRNYSFFLSDDQVFFKKNDAACEFRFDTGTKSRCRCGVLSSMWITALNSFRWGFLSSKLQAYSSSTAAASLHISESTPVSSRLPTWNIASWNSFSCRLWRICS